MVYLGATLLVFVDREAADIGYYRLVEQSSERRQLLAYDGIDSRILQSYGIYHAAPALGYARRRIAETRLARSTLDGYGVEDVEIVEIGELAAEAESAAGRNDGVV